MSQWYPGGQQSQPRPGGAPFQAPPPQQWAGGAPAFNTQSQGRGWQPAAGGGQSPWQQQPGYYGNVQPGGFPPQQQQQPVPFQQTGYQTQQQAQAQFHAMQQQKRQQQQQQQQQMAYLQEQQRLAREEERKRAVEIQKRKLKNIDVSNPAALQIEDLVELKTTSSPRGSPQTASKAAHSVRSNPPPHSSSSSSPSPSPSPRPPHATIASVESSPTPNRDPQAKASESSPLVSLSSSSLSSAQSQSEVKGTSEDEQRVPDSKETYQKLMQDSLLNLNQPSPPTGNKKMAFKTSSTMTGNRGGVGGVGSDSPKGFAQSMKARAWTAGSEELSGLFSQHVQPPTQGDDDFGTFQSGDFAGGRDALQCPPIEPATAAASQSHTQPSSQGGPLKREGVHLKGNLVGITLPTSSYSQPIPATSVCAMDKQGVVSSDARLRSMSTPYFAQTSGSNTTAGNLPPASQGAGKFQHLPPPSSGTGGQQASNFSALDTSRFPPLYHEVYKRSVKPGEDFVQTNLVFPLLVSSNLSRDLLRDLWGTANRAVPGKLSQTELFVLLGLIGLAQAGNASPTLEDLRRAPRPPIPTLSALRDAGTAPPQQPLPPSSSSSDDFGNFQQSKPKDDDFGSFASVPPMATSHKQQQQQQQQQQQRSAPPSLSSLKPSQSQPVFPSQSLKQTSQEIKPLVPAPTGGPGLRSMATSGGGGSKRSNSPLLSAQTGLKSTILAPLGTSSSSDGSGVVADSVKVADTSSSKGEAFADFKSHFDATSSSVSTTQSEGGWANFGDFSAPISPAKASGNNKLTSGVAITETENDRSTKTIDINSTKPTDKTKDIVADEFEPIPASSKKKSENDGMKSPVLTGLEILEAEMEYKVQASVAEKVDQKPTYSVPSDMTRPLRPQSSRSNDDFGEFEAFSSPTVAKKFRDGYQGELPSSTATVEGLSNSGGWGVGGGVVDVWRRCLVRCGEVMGESCAVLAGVEDSNVLEEIASTEEGTNKLRGIVEVFRLAKRVYCSMKEAYKADGVTDYVDDIFKQWKKICSILPKNVMTGLYKETAPKLAAKEESDVLSDTISKCSVCLMSNYVFISSFNAIDDLREEYHLPLAFHQGQSYHASCANFWCNAVLQDLPTL